MWRGYGIGRGLDVVVDGGCRTEDFRNNSNSLCSMKIENIQLC